MSEGSFYIPDGPGRYISTMWTRGPWDPAFQHAGPPAALVAREIEALDGGADFFVSRFTLEVLRAIPVAPLQVQATLTRPGKRVQMAEAVLRDDTGDVAIARAWRVRRGDTVDVVTPDEPPDFPGPDGGTAPGFDPWDGPSYFSGVEWRIVAGGFVDPGPATVWMRMAVPLVADEEPSPLSRVLVAADSGNGVSQVVPLNTHLFINTELTVHLFRPAEGEWVCLDAHTRIGALGTGLATTDLYDERGRIGSGAQALLVAPR